MKKKGKKMCDENLERDELDGWWDLSENPTVLQGGERIDSDENPAFTDEEHALLGERPIEISSFSFFRGRTFVGYEVWQHYESVGVPETEVPGSIMCDLLMAIFAIRECMPFDHNSQLADIVGDGMVFHGRQHWIGDRWRQGIVVIDDVFNPFWAGVRLNADRTARHMLITRQPGSGV